MTVILLLTLPPFAVAVIEGVLTAPTLRLVTVNVAVAEPAATVTEAGTVAAVVSLLESVTVVADVGVELSETVEVLLC